MSTGRKSKRERLKAEVRARIEELRDVYGDISADDMRLALVEILFRKDAGSDATQVNAARILLANDPGGSAEGEANAAELVDAIKASMARNTATGESPEDD